MQQLYYTKKLKVFAETPSSNKLSFLLFLLVQTYGTQLHI